MTMDAGPQSKAAMAAGASGSSQKSDRRRNMILLGIGLGLVVAIGAFFSGPSVTAVRARGAVKSGFDWVRGAGESHGVSTGPVGRWTYGHRMALRIGAVALAALIFVFWGRPTAAVVIWLAVLLVVVLGLIELIGRPPARAKAESPPGPPVDCRRNPQQTGLDRKGPT